MAVLLTPEDLWEIIEPGKHELIGGALRSMPPVGAVHAEIGANIIVELASFVRRQRLGRVYTPGVGFILSRDPAITLSPDVAFVREDRLPPRGQRKRFLPLSPDLAVETLSPSNTAARIAEKAQLFLAHGASVVWIVDPERHTVIVHAVGAAPRTLRADDTLDGGDVLPGFSVRVGALFE